MNVYFDNAASTKVRDEAIEAMVCVMEDGFGNPSSLHSYGRFARDKLEEARGNLADALGAKSEYVYFTSGGTEANNWAIFGVAELLMRKRKGISKGNKLPLGTVPPSDRHIITSAIEHSAVLDPIKKLERSGFEVTYLMPDSSGHITPGTFSAALRDDTVFASIMLVNNETGTVNPVGEFSNEIKRRGLGTVFHTDAIQGLNKIPFTIKSLGADLITVSSHKIHGPKGVGALYIKDGVKLAPLVLGGNHEKGIRGGTEALPAAVGFGVAAKLGHMELEEIARHVRGLREYVSDLLMAEIPDVVFIGGGDDYSPFILSISLPGHKSEVLMSFLDGEGICVSRSAACKKGARSRTLEAMQLKNDVIDGALRVSFSRYSTKEEAEYFVKVLKRASETLYKAL
ncbi:MAG: cysteine desulfurase [Oscillospiraceae bacterium]|nr:cysteine desulfurase [Oscillospiraceae bacterium]